MEQNEKSNTSQLLRELFKAASMNHYLQSHKDDPEPAALCVYLHNLCREQGVLPAQIIRNANLENSYGYQIFKGTRNPSRDTVLRLAFGFRANLPQAQELLRRAGMNALYPRVRRDAVVIYCLFHKMDLLEAQGILQELKLPMIGEK